MKNEQRKKKLNVKNLNLVGKKAEELIAVDFSRNKC